MRTEQVQYPMDIQRHHVVKIDIPRSQNGGHVHLHDGRVFEVSQSIIGWLVDADYFTRINLADNPADGHIYQPSIADDHARIAQDLEDAERATAEHQSMIGIY